MKAFLASLLSIHSTIVSRQSDPSPLLLLFRKLLDDRQLQWVEENEADSCEFVDLCELAIDVRNSIANDNLRLYCFLDGCQ